MKIEKYIFGKMHLVKFSTFSKCISERREKFQLGIGGYCMILWEIFTYPKRNLSKVMTRMKPWKFGLIVAFLEKIQG